jgi:hypothetical protein
MFLRVDEISQIGNLILETKMLDIKIAIAFSDGV